jgi:hypothetical protein
MDFGNHAPLWSSLLHAVVFFNIGLQGIFAFVGHTLKADESADKIGWPRGNPFQTEVAFANLAFGVRGALICVWPGADYLVALLLGSTIFVYGAVYTHLREYVLRKNDGTLDTGTLIYLSGALPVVWWSLLLAKSIFEERRSSLRARPSSSCAT